MLELEDGVSLWDLPPGPYQSHLGLSTLPFPDSDSSPEGYMSCHSPANTGDVGVDSLLLI